MWSIPGSRPSSYIIVTSLPFLLRSVAEVIELGMVSRAGSWGFNICMEELSLLLVCSTVLCIYVYMLYKILKTQDYFFRTWQLYFLSLHIKIVQT